MKYLTMRVRKSNQWIPQFSDRVKGNHIRIQQSKNIQTKSRKFLKVSQKEFDSKVNWKSLKVAGFLKETALKLQTERDLWS